MKRLRLGKKKGPNVVDLYSSNMAQVKLEVMRTILPRAHIKFLIDFHGNDHGEEETPALYLFFLMRIEGHGSS